MVHSNIIVGASGMRWIFVMISMGDEAAGELRGPVSLCFGMTRADVGEGRVTGNDYDDVVIILPQGMCPWKRRCTMN